MYTYFFLTIFKSLNRILEITNFNTHIRNPWPETQTSIFFKEKVSFSFFQILLYLTIVEKINFQLEETSLHKEVTMAYLL